MTDPIEDLLIEAVGLSAGERAQWLEAQCRLHPDYAEELRERVTWIDRLAPTDEEARSGEGDTFGEFELMRRLGSGGMGVVYLARQRRENLDRLVALKVIRSGPLMARQARQRFWREARATMRLHHPGICTALDVGEVDGAPFIAMRYVEGRTLAELLDECRSLRRPLRLHAETSGGFESELGRSSRGRHDELLALVEAVARALAAAHDEGLIHRDVKPANIMVDSDGAPVLLDFGLVQDEEEGEALTLTGQALGTPAYMAPEQVRGQPVDPRTDVYALGAVLYEVVALRPPLEGATRDALYRAILEQEPPSLRKVAPGTPKDLAVIAAKALRKEPRHRYQSAAEFADDLKRLRMLQPIHARPVGPLVRLALWARRNPYAALLVVGLAIGMVVFATQANRLRESQRLALTNATEAQNAVRELIGVATDELRGLPMVADLRQRMMERALGFYERFLERSREDRTVLFDSAQAQFTAARFLRELERHEEALVRAREAKAEFAALMELDPDSGQARFAHLRTEILIADCQRELGSHVSVAPLLQSYLETSASWTAEERRANFSDTIWIYDQLRVETGNRGAIDEAIRAEREFAALVRENCAEDDPLRPWYLGRTLLRLGELHCGKREYERGEELLTKGIEVLSAPGSTLHAISARARGLQVRGIHRREIGNLDGARADCEEAYRLFSQLTFAFSRSSSYLLALADAATSLANVSKGERGEELFQEALDTIDLLGDDRRVEVVVTTAKAAYGLGNLLRKRDVARAAELFERAEAALDPLVFGGQRGEAPFYQVRILAMALNNLSVMRFELGDNPGAEAALDRSLELKRRLVRLEPGNPRNSQTLAFSIGNRAKHLVRIHDDRERAVELFDECLAIRKELVVRYPEVVEYGADLLVEYRRRVGVLGRAEAAGAEEWVLSLDVARRQHYARDARFGEVWATLRVALAAHAFDNGDADEAERRLRVVLDDRPDCVPAQEWLDYVRANR